jgi:hypothetical protein
MRYSTLDPHYLAQLDDIVLMHTAAQYQTTLRSLPASSEHTRQMASEIRGCLNAVKAELERRGLDSTGWLLEAEQTEENDAGDQGMSSTL